MCYTIEEIKTKITPIAQTYGVKSVSLFGSYARGEATVESDIDIYIEKGSLRTLLQYYSMLHELEQQFNCHVDLITTDIDDKEFLQKIQEEGVLLYAS